MLNVVQIMAPPNIFNQAIHKFNTEVTEICLISPVEPFCRPLSYYPASSLVI